MAALAFPPLVLLPSIPASLDCQDAFGSHMWSALQGILVSKSSRKGDAFPQDRLCYGGMRGVWGFRGHRTFPVRFKLCYAGDLPGPELVLGAGQGPESASPALGEATGGCSLP